MRQLALLLALGILGVKGNEETPLLPFETCDLKDDGCDKSLGLYCIPQSYDGDRCGCLQSHNFIYVGVYNRTLNKKVSSFCHPAFSEYYCDGESPKETQDKYQPSKTVAMWKNKCFTGYPHEKKRRMCKDNKCVCIDGSPIKKPTTEKHVYNMRSWDWVYTELQMNDVTEEMIQTQQKKHFYACLIPCKEGQSKNKKGKCVDSSKLKAAEL